MKRRVHTAPLDKWIDENGPNGLVKFAIKSELSPATLTKVRGGYVPPKAITRRKIYLALGVTEDEIFPVERSTGKRAAG